MEWTEDQLLNQYGGRRERSTARYGRTGVNLMRRQWNDVERLASTCVLAALRKARRPFAIQVADGRKSGLSVGANPEFEKRGFVGGFGDGSWNSSGGDGVMAQR